MPGVTTLRGYGSEHQKLRKLLEPVVLSGQARCTRCRRLIAPGARWDLDHTEDRGGYLGPAHRGEGQSNAPEGAVGCSRRFAGCVEVVVMGEAAEKVEALLGEIELEPAMGVNAAIARALAAKLDETREAESAAASMAIAGIAKELRAVIDEIRSATDDQSGFVTDLFS
jgi:hypothetical protein